MNNVNALVLAGGPSVSNLEQNPGLIALLPQNCKIFAVNNFPLSTLASKLKIFAWVISDPASFSFTHIKKIGKLDYFCPDYIFLPLARKIEWESTFNEIFNSKIIYFNDNQYSTLLSKNIDPTKPRGYVSLTSYKALSIAVYMNFNRIFLLGFDNTYIVDFEVDENNLVFANSKHFDSSAYPSDVENPKRLVSGSVAEYMRENLILLDDLDKFPKDKIFNLNVDSINDRFAKIKDLNSIILHN